MVRYNRSMNVVQNWPHGKSYLTALDVFSKCMVIRPMHSRFYRKGLPRTRKLRVNIFNVIPTFQNNLSLSEILKLRKVEHM